MEITAKIFYGVAWNSKYFTVLTYTKVKMWATRTQETILPGHVPVCSELQEI